MKKMVVVLFAVILLATLVSQSSPTQAGPVVSNGNPSFFGQELPGTGGYYALQNAAWVIGVKNFSGATPTYNGPVEFVSNGVWSIDILFPQQWAGGMNHWALRVTGGKFKIDDGGWVNNWGGTRGIGFNVGQSARLSFDPASQQQIIRWGEDPDRQAEWGPGGSAAARAVDWFSPNTLPGEPAWHYVVSQHNKDDHGSTDCAHAFAIHENIVLEPGRIAPMDICARLQLQKGHPTNTLSGYIKFKMKAGPDYQREVDFYPPRGIPADQLALEIIGEADVTVRFSYQGHQVIQNFEVRGSSEAIAFKPGGGEVEVEVQLPRVGANAYLGWGPDYGPRPQWGAKYGPSGTIIRSGTQ